MARTLHHILVVPFVVALCLAASKPAYAQEVNSSNYDIYASDSDRERERDRTIYTAGESTDPLATHKSTTSTVSVKDSASTVRVPAQRATRQPAEPAKTSPKPKEEDESILSFNFLYYIIQKYKLQDIVD